MRPRAPCRGTRRAGDRALRPSTSEELASKSHRVEGAALDQHPVSRRRQREFQPAIDGAGPISPGSSGWVRRVLDTKLQGGMPSDREDATPLEINKGEAAPGIQVEVAERCEHAVAGIVGDVDGPVGDHVDESWSSPAVRHVEAALAVHAGDENRVSASDETTSFVVEGTASLYRPGILA